MSKAVLETVYKKVSEKTGIKVPQLRAISEDFFRTLFNMCVEKHKKGEDFCAKLTYLGKVYTKNKFKNENKENQTDVQSCDNNDGQIREK